MTLRLAGGRWSPRLLRRGFAARARLLRLRGGDGRFLHRRELPSGEVVLIIGFGPKLETTYPRLRPIAAPCTARSSLGRHETHRLVATPGNQVGIQLNLTPSALTAARPAHARADQPRRRARRPARRRRRGWSSSSTTRPTGRPAFALLDEVLVRRLDAARPAPPMSPGPGGGWSTPAVACPWASCESWPPPHAAPVQRADRRRAEDLRPRAALPNAPSTCLATATARAGSTSASWAPAGG